MHPFHYINKNEHLLMSQRFYEMQANIGKKIKFTIYDKKGFPKDEKTGTIISVSHSDYLVNCSGKKFFVSSDDYISIF